MAVYTKSMMEALAEVRLQEDNMDLMRKAAGGAMQTIKMKDGKLKMDSFTASGIMQVYDKVNPKNKKAMEQMINSGKKSQIMKLQALALKAGYNEEAELDEGDPFMGPTKGKGKVVTVRHKTSGKELAVTANSVKKYEKMGYEVVKETTEIGERVAEQLSKIIGIKNEAYELGTNEYREYLEKLTPGEVDEASARADAMKAMRRDKKVDPADVDVDASDADVKAASKNILAQMRKASNLGGRFEVEFLDKKKVKVKLAIANAFIKKYESMRKPADKEKLQNQAMKSYKDLLKVLKAGYNEEVELDEALPSHLKKHFDKDGNPKSKEGKAAWERLATSKGYRKYTSQQIKMAIGVAFDKRYVQGNMTGAAKTIEKIAKGLSDIEPVANALRRANENTILDRIDIKLKERKNG